MEYKSGTEGYYRQMLELQDKLRRSEEERLKLEEKFNEIMQRSRDAEYERLRTMRHKYHKFLEEDKVRQERNENILRTLNRIECRAKQFAAKTDRFKTFRKQYFENYLKQIQDQKYQTYDTQTMNQPHYEHENVRRKLFTDQPPTTNENVETKLALLEKYLRDNFDNFPQELPSSNINPNQNETQSNILHKNQKYFDDVSDSKESQEADRFSPNGINGYYQETSEILGNRIEEELNRLRNKNEKELNNNLFDEISPEHAINDYKKLVLKSEEKFGLKTGLQNDAKKVAPFDYNNKIGNLTNFAPIDVTDKPQLDDILPNAENVEEIGLKLDLLEEEENSEDTKPPTDISLNLSSPSQLKEQLSDNDQIEGTSKSEEITSIEKQINLQAKPLESDHETNQTHLKQIPNKFDIQSSEILNDSQHTKQLEQQQTSDYNPKFKASNYSEQETTNSQQESINTNQQNIEQTHPKEFGELVAKQQLSEEQKYPSEVYSEEYQQEIQEQYDGIAQPEYTQDYENTNIQSSVEETYDKQQYNNPEQQYTNVEQYPNLEQQYINPEQYPNLEQQYINPEKYPNSEQQYGINPEEYSNPDQQYATPEQQYTNPEQQYTNPEQQYTSSEQQDVSPELQYENSDYKNPEQHAQPGEQYETPDQQFINPEQKYETPDQQQYLNPEQQYEASNQQQYINPEQQYETPDQQQYETPDQQFANPEQQYESPEQQNEIPGQQFVNPEQQEYQPDNYDQQYQQQNFQEGEYNSQNYPIDYDTQQQNYDSQNYPQQQYPEGYDPQQYTEEQQYPQEGYQNEQFVENTGEYEQQLQPAENLYQTGQEYLQGEQNVDLQYETEHQQEYPEGFVGNEQESLVEKIVDGTITESSEISGNSGQTLLEDNAPLIQKKLPNLADMLDTDTSESIKPEKKVSESDFDFSSNNT